MAGSTSGGLLSFVTTASGLFSALTPSLFDDMYYVDLVNSNSTSYELFLYSQGNDGTAQHR
jgi:hypothetical protein